MKHLLATLLILIGFTVQAQNVFEYSIDGKLEFKVYSENESILHKISNSKDFKQDTPENVASSFFFATTNGLLSSLYLDKQKFKSHDDSDFEGDEMAFIMFIVRIKDVPFPFPTLLSLIKKENKWFVEKRPNQQKMTDCLMMFKPCVLSNLVEGVSMDNDIINLIFKTKSTKGVLDFTKLFDELVIIQENKDISNKLTMSQNLDCESINFKNAVLGKNYFTGIFKNTSIKLFEKQDEKIISQIKKNNDSIVLTSRLDFDFANKNYAVIKYNDIKTNGEIVKKSFYLYNNNDMAKPAKEIIFLFENLKTAIFSDLMPNLTKTPIMENELYKKTRGVYDVLNISKLFELYNNDKTLFVKYLDN